MNREKRIEIIIKKYFKEYNIKIVNNSDQHIGHNDFDGSQESHFLVILENIKNKKLNRLSIHRKINQLLKKEFINGMHALEIKIIN